MQREETEAMRRARIDRERRAKPQTKVCFVLCLIALMLIPSPQCKGPLDRLPGPSSSSNQYRLRAVRPYLLLPFSAEATATLNRLADYPAVRHVMQVHKSTVGVLTLLRVRAARASG